MTIKGKQYTNNREQISEEKVLQKGQMEMFKIYVFTDKTDITRKVNVTRNTANSKLALENHLA